MCHMFSFLVVSSVFFLFFFSFLKTRMEAVIVMVIHSWVAMVKSISPLPLPLLNALV